MNKILHRVGSRALAILPNAVADPLRRIYHCVRGPRPAVPLAIGTFDGFELAYRRGTVDEKVIEESFNRDVYFSSLPEYQRNVSDVIIDVGGHIGTFALLAASRVPDGRVVVVEACSETFAFLRINLALNHAHNVTPVKAALAGHSGQVTLHHASANWGHTTVTKRNGGTSETVRALTLEELLEENGLPHGDLLKLNCEGAEFPILLASSTETLQRFRVILALYHSDLYPGTETEQDLAIHLASAGFRTDLRNRTGKRGWLVAHRPESNEGVSGDAVMG